MIYVLLDGTVRFTFVQPKQILDIYRLLCSGKTAAYEALCQLFDAETANGSLMGPYNKLLAAAVESIARTFQKRLAAGLQSGRVSSFPTRTNRRAKTLNSNSSPGSLSRIRV